MKVLLINPPIREWALPNCFPSGLGYLTRYLVDAGHDVEILDINAHRFTDEDIERRIGEATFDIAAIGGLITVYRKIKKITKLLKKYHPDKKVVVGGSVATSIPRTLLQNASVDIACIGEGEYTFLDILNAVENDLPLKNVCGIWFKSENGDIVSTPPRPLIKVLDDIKFPLWDMFQMDIYLKNPIGALNSDKWGNGTIESERLSMNIIPTRGCAYQCIYCYHDFMGAGYRFRSAENIIEEMLYLKETYGVDYFHFNDDCFIINRKNVVRMCDLLIQRGIKINWGCSGRVNLMSEELIVKMKAAGCILIGYGIESGSQKILDTLNKQVTVAQAKQTIRWTQKHLGWADCSFMVGAPGESTETIRETVSFCKELGLAPEVIFFITPYPGTDLYRMAVEHGKIKDEEELVLSLGEQGEQLLVNFTDFSDEELVKIKQEMVHDLGAWNKNRHSPDSY